MSRPRSLKTHAIVLRQMPLGEADRILTLYTPGQGKLRAVARGVRRINSRLGGHLEVLNRVSVSLSLGRNLDVISEAVAVESYRQLREDLQKVSSALYLAELVDIFSADGSPNHSIYRLLADSLGWLETSDHHDRLLRFFELMLLGHSGFRPELYQCVECQENLEPGDHLFSYAKGGALCPKCHDRSGEALAPLPFVAMKVMRFLQREGYERVVDLNVGAAVWTDIHRLLRNYLRYVAERDFKTADFMRLVASRAEPVSRTRTARGRR